MTRLRVFFIAGGLIACLAALPAGRAIFSTHARLDTAHLKPSFAAPADRSVAPQHAAINVPSPLFASVTPPHPADATVTPPPEPLPRLSGIVMSGKVGHAIFESNGQLQDSAVGDRLGAYRIVGIAPTTVTVQGPQGVLTLQPDTGGAQSQANGASAPGGQPPSLLDQLNTQPPPVVPLPRPPSLTQMLARLPRSH